MNRHFSFKGFVATAVFALGAAPFASGQDAVTPAIPGVVRAGTPVQLVRDGYESVEGPLPRADGGLLFTNNRAHRIERLGPDGPEASWWEGAGGANALTMLPDGEVAATLTELHAIGIVRPGEPARVLVDAFQGMPFGRPNDLVANRRGDVYFTDLVPPSTEPGAMPSGLYLRTAGGELSRVEADVARPNGVALSPDERTLYLADTAGPTVFAYALDRSGRPSGRRAFAQLALPAPAEGARPGTASGADGMAVDSDGRLYVATTLGVQVFSSRGRALGIIPLPKAPQNLAFAGPRRADLYVVGRGAVYRIPTLVRGPRREGK